MRKFTFGFGLLVCLFSNLSSAIAQNACLISGRGYFRIHADAGGLFGAFAHDHLIEAQKIEGCAAMDSQNPARSSVKVTFQTSGLRVLDPKEKPEDREKVQMNMEKEVLRIADFPRIAFESIAIESAGSDRFRVRGSAWSSHQCGRT